MDPSRFHWVKGGRFALRSARTMRITNPVPLTRAEATNHGAMRAVFQKALETLIEKIHANRLTKPDALIDEDAVASGA